MNCGLCKKRSLRLWAVNTASNAQSKPYSKDNPSNFVLSVPEDLITSIRVADRFSPLET